MPCAPGAGDQQHVGVPRACGEEDAEPVRCHRQGSAAPRSPAPRSVRSGVHVPQVHRPPQRRGPPASAARTAASSCSVSARSGTTRPGLVSAAAAIPARPGEHVRPLLNAPAAEHAPALVQDNAASDGRLRRSRQSGTVPPGQRCRRPASGPAPWPARASRRRRVRPSRPAGRHHARPAVRAAPTGSQRHPRRRQAEAGLDEREVGQDVSGEHLVEQHQVVERRRPRPAPRDPAVLDPQVVQRPRPAGPRPSRPPGPTRPRTATASGPSPRIAELVGGLPEQLKDWRTSSQRTRSRASASPARCSGGVARPRSGISVVRPAQPRIVAVTGRLADRAERAVLARPAPAAAARCRAAGQGTTRCPSAPGRRR